MKLCIFFFLFYLVLSKPICCINCGNAFALDYEDDFDVLENPTVNPTIIPCSKRNVCQVLCSGFDPKCTKKLFLDIEFENRIESRAFTEICLERDPKYYQDLQNQTDSIWNRMKVPFREEDFLKKPISDGHFKSYQIAFDYFSQNPDYPKRNLIFAVVNYVKLQRAFKKVCYNEPDASHNMVKNIQKIMKIDASTIDKIERKLHRDTPKEKSSDAEKMAYIEKNKGEFDEKVPNKHSIWRVKYFIQSIIEGLTTEEKILFNSLSNKMMNEFIQYMQKHSQNAGNYCNCMAFENFAKIDLEEIQKDKDSYVSERVRENISPFLPKGFISSSLGKELSGKIQGYLTNYQKRILERKAFIEGECKRICQ